VKKATKAKLAELGITSESYTIENPDYPNVIDRWGITLDGPRASWFVEYQRDRYGGRPRYYLRPKRGGNTFLTERKTQREAIADYIRLVYNV
jgi:hypothetical protein